MSMQRVLRSFGFTTLVICATSMCSSPFAAIAGPTVSFEPTPLCGGLPDTLQTFTASIWVDASGDSLGCYHLLMTYDRSYLHLNRAMEGDLFRLAGPPYLFIHEYPELDTTAFTCCLLGNRTYVQGPGEIVKLQFRVLDCPSGNRATLDLVTYRKSPPPEDFAFFADIDRNLIPGVEYRDGLAWLCDECVSSTQEELTVRRAALDALPNPAANRLALEWMLAPEISNAWIEVFATDGRRVLSRRVGPGSGVIDWNLLDETGGPIPSGAYFIRLRANEETILRKIVRVR